MRNTARLAVCSIAILGAVQAFAAPKFLFFAPGDTTSPDGKTSMAAFSNGKPADGNAPSVNYYFTRINPATGKVGIVSDVVFDGYSTFPDIRGYGPVKSSWSIADLPAGASPADDNQYPRQVGDLVGSLWQSRKSAQVVFHQLKKVGTVSKFVRVAAFDDQKIAAQGLAELKKKATEKGYDCDNEMFGYFTEESFVRLAANGKDYEEDNWNAFDLSDGRLVRITGSYYFEKKNDSTKSSDGDYTAIVRVSLDSRGAPKVEVVSISAGLK